MKTNDGINSGNRAYDLTHIYIYIYMIDLYRFTLLLERCIRLNDRRIIEFLSSRELTKSIDREEEERGGGEIEENR